MPEPNGTASCFGAVLAEELDEIRKRRSIRARDLTEVLVPPSETSRPEEVFPRRNAIQQPPAEPPAAPAVTTQPETQAPGAPAGQSQKSTDSSIKAANQADLLGLAFSGGGI